MGDSRSLRVRLFREADQVVALSWFGVGSRPNAGSKRSQGVGLGALGSIRLEESRDKGR